MNHWMELLKKLRKENPKLSFKEILKLGKKTHKKSKKYHKKSKKYHKKSKKHHKSRGGSGYYSADRPTSASLTVRAEDEDEADQVIFDKAKGSNFNFLFNDRPYMTKGLKENTI